MPIVSRLSPPSAEEIEAGQRGLAVVQMLTGHWVAQIVRTAAELRVMDHVADGAQTADAVAGLEHSDPKATYRLMRACARVPRPARHHRRWHVHGDADRAAAPRRRPRLAA